MENIPLSEKYKKELIFLNKYIKPSILKFENIEDCFIDIKIDNKYVKFCFIFGHDYFQFLIIKYKNNKFFNNNNVEHTEISNKFSKYL